MDTPPTLPSLPDTDHAPPAPLANAPYTPPPLPVLGGAYAGGAGLQQAWTTDRHTFEMKVKAGRQSWKDA
ncbi:MAG: hypothetical protein H7Y38_04790, partial [Armatimonadetes bacterium]|nr:hypothetical protein [Armatimonadota bacterium]